MIARAGEAQLSCWVLKRVGAPIAIAVGLCVSLGGGVAIAQTCDQSQPQLTQAIVDSQTALDRVEVHLNEFGARLISPRSEPIDNSAVLTARASMDEFIAALSDFSAQVNPLGNSCGPNFAADVQTLNGTLERFRAQRTRVDQLLSDHQALVDSGEPPMNQADIEAIQSALTNLGFHQQAIDGRLGSATRASIRAFQSARGYSATGYLIAEQIRELLSAPEASEPVDEPSDEVAGLPPAPGESEQPAVSDETREVCAANTAQVERAVERTRDFREELSPQINALRLTLRGPRIPQPEIRAELRIADDTAAYLEQLLPFFQEAEAAAGICGAVYDTALASLDNQIVALDSVQQSAAQVTRDYEALIASGEPAMGRDEMQEIQRGLQETGHYSGGIDAVFGPGTRNAIRAYQGEIGARQTGYLTPEQIANLRRAAVEVNDDQPEVAAVESPEPAAEDETPAPIELAAVRTMLEQTLSGRQPEPPLSEIASEAGMTGMIWWRLHDTLSAGRPSDVVAGRLSLLGATYMDHTPDSLAMVDAHVLIGDAYAALGLYEDAVLHLERALSIWRALGRDAPVELAGLLEKLATAHLADVVARDALDSGRFDRILVMLTDARLTAEAGVGTDDPVTMALVDRLADLLAAANVDADDAEVAAAIDRRYRGQ